MPNRWAIQNGNWSDPTTWSGSLIPTSADDVFANNRTVNVNTSFQVLTLRNSASASAITAGGSFNFNSGSISGSATAATPLFFGGANLITVIAATGSVTLTLGGATDASSFNNTGILHSGNCNFNLIGTNITASAAGGTTTTFIDKTSSGTITIVGNLLGGPNTSPLRSTAGNTVISGSIASGNQSGGSTGLVQSAGTLIVSGNIIAAGSSTNGGATGILFSGQSLTINGNIFGGTLGAVPSVGVSTTAPITVSGNITGGVAAGISSTSPISIIVTGSVTGGTGAAGISTTTTPLLIVSGACIAANQPAVINTNASALNIFTGPFTNVSGTMAIQCINAVLTQDASTTWDFGDTILYSPDQLAYYPSASDIRQGVTYADGTVSGSLAMPPPTAVIAGTPTDNTTGSAILTPEQLQDAVWGRDLSQMTETGSIGFRLAKSATTDSTGNQLASYLI